MLGTAGPVTSVDHAKALAGEETEALGVVGELGHGARVGRGSNPTPGGPSARCGAHGQPDAGVRRLPRMDTRFTLDISRGPAEDPLFLTKCLREAAEHYSGGDYLANGIGGFIYEPSLFGSGPSAASYKWVCRRRWS